MGARNKNFHTAPLPNCGSNPVRWPAPDPREIRVCILFVDVARGIAEQSDVKFNLRRNT